MVFILIDYVYDGTFEGLLTAIFYAYSSKVSCNIVSYKNYTPSLLTEVNEINTDKNLFNRVYNSILKRLDYVVLKNIYYLYLSEIKNSENIILSYLKLCYKYGTTINLAKNNDTIILIDKYYRKVSLEAHKFTGFVRFKEIAPLSFYASIEPDYNILPIISNHFVKRFSDQNFIIHDLKRESAIIYNKETFIIANLSKKEALNFNKNNSDSFFEELWNTFYKSVNIEERKNLKLRNQYMPKKYWKHLTEI